MRDMPRGGSSPPMIHSSGKMKPMMNSTHLPLRMVLMPSTTSSAR